MAIQEEQLQPGINVHKWSEWSVKEAATDTKDGVKSRVCSICHKEQTEVIKKTGKQESKKLLKKDDRFTVGDFTYLVLSDAEGKVTAALVQSKNKKLKKTTVDTVAYEGVTVTVTEIGDKVFKGHKKLKSIVLGAQITKIGKQAFSGCKALRQIKIKSAVLKTVGKKALKGIHKKCAIKVPKKKVKAYKKLFKNKGQKKTVKVKKG